VEAVIFKRFFWFGLKTTTLLMTDLRLDPHN